MHRLLWATFLLGICYTLADTVVQSDDCLSYCDNTFALHTSDNADGVKICQQGCRLYQLIEFTTDKNVTKVQQNCLEACKEAYSKKNQFDACSNGCKHQLPSTNGNFEMVVDADSPLYAAVAPYFDRMRQSMMKQMDNFRSQFGLPSWSDIEKQFQDFRKQFQLPFNSPFFSDSSTSTLLNSDNLKGDIGLPVDSATKQKSSSFGDNQEENPLHVFGSSVAENPRLEDRHRGDIFDGPTVDNINSNTGDTILSVRILPLNTDESQTEGWWHQTSPHDPPTPVETNDAVDPDDSWLTWLAARSRQVSVSTRWMLIGAMLLCVASMLWICMAIVRSAPRRRRMLLISQHPFSTTNEIKKHPILESPHQDYPTDKMQMLLDGYHQTPAAAAVPPPPSESGAPPAYESQQNSPTVHKKFVDAVEPPMNNEEK